MFKISVNVHLDGLSPSAEPFVAKVGMVIHRHGPECHAKRRVGLLSSWSRSQ